MGFAGGSRAERARIVRNLGRAGEEELGKIDVVDVALGDTITELTPGGDGYGIATSATRRSCSRHLAWRRNPSARNRGLGRGHRRRRGGEAGTARLRSERRQPRGDRAFDFGRERRLADFAVGHGLTENLVRERYAQLAPSERMTTRYAIFGPIARVINRSEPFDPAKLADAASEIWRNLGVDDPDRGDPAVPCSASLGRSLP